MKKILLPLVIMIVFFSCKNKNEEGRFTVNGELKNASDQKIYLEELFFSQKDPEVLDTANIKNGKFSLTAIAPEQGLYRIRIENNNIGFIFINDKPTINFTADLNDKSLTGPSFASPVNQTLKQFIVVIDSQRNVLSGLSTKLELDKTAKISDSILTLESKYLDDVNTANKNFIIKYIDTVSNPVMVLFALGFTRNIDPSQLQQPINGLSARFPKHNAVTAVVTQFNTMVAQTKQQEEAKSHSPQEGSMAPDITMNDINGKSFSLSQLRGKFVLVDFWASWCGPCRGENPNVVAAYNQFKNKNFTVLGVSLDDNKEDWMKAIAEDQLNWQHISDLKKWNSVVVALYGFDRIPYNVLVDPQGKIIATALRGEALQQKLSEVIK